MSSTFFLKEKSDKRLSFTPLLYVHDYLVLFRREVAPIISHFPTTYTTSTKLYPEAFLAPKLPTVNVERDKEREMGGERRKK